MNLHKINFLFILLLLIFSCSKKNLKTNDGVSKIDILQKKIKKSNNDSILVYLGQIDKLIKVNPTIPDSLITETYFLKGQYYLKYKNNKDSVFYFFKKVILSVDEIKRKREVTYFKTIANTYLLKGDYSNANSTIDKLKNLTFKKNLGFIYNFKQRANQKIKNYNKSLEFNKLAVRFFKSKKDTNAIVVSLISQANLYYRYFNNEKKALKILDSLSLTNSLSNYNKNQINQNYGIIYFYDNDYKKAIKHYKKAVENIKQTNNKKELAITYINISEAYYQLNDIDNYKKYTDSTKIYWNYLGSSHQKFLLGLDLKQSYNSKNNIDNVINEFYDLYAFQENVYNERINNESIVLKEAFQKEKDLLLTNQQTEYRNLILKRNQYILLITILLASLIGFFIYKQRKLKLAKDKLLMQQRLFRAQMNPHFTSNALETIQGLIHQNSSKASESLINFSRILRLSLNNSTQNYVLIEDEIELIEKYLELMLLQNPNRFNYHIELVNISDNDIIYIPPMLIQPFIENAIKHGFKGIDYLGIIKIKLTKLNAVINCEIEDNGIGFSEKIISNNKKSSTQLIDYLLKKITKKGVTITNKSKFSNQNGTFVKLDIPYKTHF